MTPPQSHQFRFCPNCKSENFLFKDFRKFECFNCGMVYYQNVAAAVAVIFERNDKILFTIRNKAPQKGMLDLPGGFVDPDEKAEQACSRELKEELGIRIDPSDFHYLTSFPNHYEYRDFMYKTGDLIFTAQFPQDTTVILEEDEIDGIRWIGKEDIHPEEIGFDSLRKAIKTFLKS